MTIEEIIAQVRTNMSGLLTERAPHETAATELREAVGAGTPTAEQSTQLRAAADGMTAIDAQLTVLAERETELLEQQRSETATAALRARLQPATTGRGSSGLQGITESLTYERGSKRSFFADFYNAREKGDFGAQQRLNQHMVELRQLGADGAERAATTDSSAGLTPPVYLTDLAAPLIKAGRPYIDAIGHLDLPDEGMNLVIPRQTAAPGAGSQVTQNTQVVNTPDTAYSDLTVPVRTIAGEQDVSRQMLERGTSGADQMVMNDLARSYGLELNRQALAGTGNVGEHKGVLAAAGTIGVSVTAATALALYIAIQNAFQQVNSNSPFAPATLITMHPRRWAALKSAVDSNNRPLFASVNQYPQNALGTGDGAPSQRIVGDIDGVPVVTDPSIPTNLGAGTNEDRVLVQAKEFVHLWEDPAAPLQLRFDQTKATTLTVVMLAYGYSAFTAERYPKATAILSGAGLVTPTF